MRPYRIVMTLMIIGAAGISTPGITLGQDSKSGTAPSSDTPSQIAPKPTSAAPSENAAEVAPSGAVDRGIKIRKSIPVMGKGKRWAVVVGIQYTKEDRSAWKDRGEIPPLANAENDADDFATMLKGKYGYTEDKVFLLKGKEATRDAITDLLAEG